MIRHRAVVRILRWTVPWALIAAALPTLSGQDGLDESQNRRVTPIVKVVRKVGPTVVNLYTSIDFSTFFGMQAETGSLGSGVIVHPSGIVVTNSHVITANLDTSRLRDIDITVSYRPHWSGPGSDRVEQYKARLLGFNPEHDLALLKIDADLTFPAATLGTSSDLMVGETVVAVGNPFGREGSVTHGIISATNRPLAGPYGDEFRDLIQTDAPLNAGNSGGPLFNILGELIGINQAIGADRQLGRAEGQGLAIPVDRVRQLLEQQFSPFHLAHGYLGMELSTNPTRALVERIDPNGPAARAGLLAGDEIVRVGTYAVQTRLDFNLSFFSYQSGETVPIAYQRGGRRHETNLTMQSLETTIRELLGVDLRINPRLRDGALVVHVYPNGAAAAVNIRKNDLIAQLGERRIRSLQDVFIALQSRTGSTLYVRVRRYLDETFRYYEWLEGELVIR